MIPFAANAAATLQRRLSMLLNGPDNLRKLPLPLRDRHPRLINGSLSPPESSCKTASRSRFSSFCTVHRRVSYYFTMGRYDSFPPKLPLFLGGSGPSSNTWYLWLTQVINPNGISIGSNAMLCNALSMGKKIPKIGPSPWDFVTPPEGDRATAIGNTHQNSLQIASVVQEICSRTDTHTQTHRHTDVLITILHRSRGRSKTDFGSAQPVSYDEERCRIGYGNLKIDQCEVGRNRMVLATRSLEEQAKCRWADVRQESVGWFHQSS